MSRWLDVQSTETDLVGTRVVLEVVVSEKEGAADGLGDSFEPSLREGTGVLVSVVEAGRVIVRGGLGLGVDEGYTDRCHAKELIVFSYKSQNPLLVVEVVGSVEDTMSSELGLDLGYSTCELPRCSGPVKGK